jgi:hypothetical protein
MLYYRQSPASTARKAGAQRFDFPGEGPLQQIVGAGCIALGIAVVADEARKIKVGT